MSEKVGMERLVHEGMSDRKLGKKHRYYSNEYSLVKHSSQLTSLYEIRSHLIKTILYT